MKKEKKLTPYISTKCAICKTHNNFNILYPENLKSFGEVSKKYHSRRIPDKLHFRIVRCKKCGLTYSNPIYNPKLIEKMYKVSTVPLTSELDNASNAYVRYLKKLSTLKGSLLEIGCGNGFFLKKAQTLDFDDIWGIEPSKDVFKNFPKEINKRKIINDVFKKGQFVANSFDLICSFHVLDHVLDPNLFISEVYRILKPGGTSFMVMHNAKSPIHKILGERSPIFDVQHIYLFDKKNIQKIFVENKFCAYKVFSFKNTYSIKYWLTMSPIASDQLNRIIKSKKIKKLLKLQLTMRIGNMGIIVKKPT